MSIATSAVVQSSRILCLLKLAMACVLFVTAWQIITISASKTPGIVQVLACLICGFAGCLLALSCRTQVKTLRIDITATGQIRLTHTSRDAFVHGTDQHTQVANESEVVQLLKDSTLWSSMLILRLRNQSGKVIVLPILRDSMTKNAFRSVCVACHWIAAQNTRHASASSQSESQFD
jgi:hypothetical protein